MSAFFDYPENDGGSAAGGDSLFLEALSASEWKRLVGLMERRRFRAGDIVMARGESDRSLYLVAEGTVEVLVPHRGRERRVREQGPGTIMGEVAFFDGQPRSATTRAVTACEVLRLSPEGFEVLGARHPELARQVLLDLGRVLAQRLRQAEAHDGS